MNRALCICMICDNILVVRLQEMSPAVIQGNDQVTGHIISTTIGGKNGEPKRVRMILMKYCKYLVDGFMEPIFLEANVLYVAD